MSCELSYLGHHDQDEQVWTVEDVAAMDAAQVDAGDAADTAPAATTRQAVSGTYRNTSATQQLDLRVDLDGVRPLRRISGDLYKIAGGTVTYFGSFIVNAPSLQVTSSLVTASGIGRFTFNNPSPFVTVRISRVLPGMALAPARVTFSSAAGAAGTTLSCAFATRAFRVVQWEQDSIGGTTPFDSYDVSLLPSGGRARVLTVPTAYAEAGIEVQVGGASNIFPVPQNVGAKWSDAELHASMVQHFSLFSDDPQWRVWLLVATQHELDGVRGIMFDRIGRHRQGCAVFDTLVGGNTPQKKRAALRTYVHELGHCFNLLHSWQKSLAVPPQPDRLDALSYMNYVQNFPGGESAYWAAFPFQFDDPEIVHLRHGFRNDVIMGGSDFKRGAADIDELMVSRPVVDNSGLELRLEGPSRNTGDGGLAHRYQLGEPVVAELRLAAFDTRGRQVHEHLHPNYGYVRIVVRQPDGSLSLFRPLVDRCIETSIVMLTPEKPMYTSAYIGYGKDGFTFRQPGFYDIRAVYQAPDGSDVVSNILRVRVGSPRNDADEDIADLYFGEDQGKLFTFLGSDALTSGNDAFSRVIETYPAHPLTSYANFVKGMNAKREFKRVTAEKTIDARKPSPKEVVPYFDAVTRGTLDNLTTNKAFRELAVAQAQLGNTTAAKNTLKKMVKHFEQQNLKQRVLETIRAQAQATEESFT